MTLYYFEKYATEDRTFACEIDPTLLDEIAAMPDEDDQWDAADNIYVDKDGPAAIMMFRDLIDQWPVVKGHLNVHGSWTGKGEEGVFSLSTKSPEAAMQHAAMVYIVHF
jgi:hypothetical protein